MSDYEITEIIHDEQKRILTYKGETIYELSISAVFTVNNGELIRNDDLLIISYNDIGLYNIYKDCMINGCYIIYDENKKYKTHQVSRITNPNIIQSSTELYELYFDMNADAELFADILNHLVNYRSNLIKLLEEVKLQDFSNIKNAN